MSILKRLVMIRTISFLFLILLFACSIEQRDKRVVRGDDEYYLNTPPLKRLNIPQGIILPLQYGTYNINQVSKKSEVRKKLDIRPPIQPLLLLKDSRIESTFNISKLLLDSNYKNNKLWLHINKIIQNQSFPIANRNDVNKILTTDWIKWNRSDKEELCEGRYQIRVLKQGNKIALVVESLGLQQQGKIVTSNIEIQNYNLALLNKLIEGLYKIYSDTNNAQTIDNISRLDL